MWGSEAPGGSRQEKTLKLAKLQFFLKQRQVPSEMAAMVQRQARSVPHPTPESSTEQMLTNRNKD
eukprot:3688171-Amphidinium_carterae.1